ncbi:MAG TPA: hypothetical protein VMV61_10435 [Patescibacteria group bacterium]|nr:hypothetical protein [Patescibacteria group bacterium]
MEIEEAEERRRGEEEREEKITQRRRGRREGRDAEISKDGKAVSSPARAGEE